MLRFDIITIFPNMFSAVFAESIIKRAQEKKKVVVKVHDLRVFTKDKHKKVDDRPFGGGPGMVLRPEPVVECVEDVQKRAEPAGHLVMLTPQGRRLDQPLVEQLASHKRLVLICGRYEGIDQRAIDILRPEEISIGDFILNGGEVAAMVVIGLSISTWRPRTWLSPLRHTPFRNWEAE